MKIWTLIENTSSRGDLAAEHGLSLYIEVGEKRILFDAGQSGAFADNAQKMGIDLSRVDLAVLSHGHYDHGGGIRRFLELNSNAMVYVNPYAFEPHFNAAEKDIGIDPTLAQSGRIVPVMGEKDLGHGVSILPGECLKLLQPVESNGMTYVTEGVRKPEDFRHEQYLLLREGAKRVLISGCSHRGILNIAGWFRPDVLVGGFHFKHLDPAGEGATVLADGAHALLKYPAIYYTGHCTGQPQFDYLKQIMGNRLHALSTGSVIEI